MRDKLIMHLQQDLARIEVEEVEDIVDLMLEKSIDRPLTGVAEALLLSHIQLGPLLSTLLRMQWVIVQNLLQTIDQHNVKTQTAALASSMNHFSELQAAIVDTYNQNWQTKIDKEVEARVLAQCQAQWLSSGFVTLHNYFNEMPVVVKAKLRSAEGTHISIEYKDELSMLFACSENQHSALVASTDRKYNILLSALDYHAERLILGVHHVERSIGESREHVRIHQLEETCIAMKSDGVVVNGLLVNISISGLKMQYQGEEAVKAGAHVVCAWRYENNKIMLEATVRWAFVSDGVVQVGVKFTSTGPYAERIQKLVFSQQQKTIAQLKVLGTPDWLKEQ